MWPDQCLTLLDQEGQQQLTLENQDECAQLFVESSQASAVSASRQLDIDRRSLRRIMDKIGLKCYIPQGVHNFANCFLTNLTKYPNSWITSFGLTNQLSNYPAIWTAVCVYYDTSNPHVAIEKHLNQPGVSVWAGLSSDGVIGPIFLDGILTGEKYLTLLQRDVLPILQQREDFDDIWLQQDGAPPHFAKCVRGFLHQTFPGRWLGRRGCVDWPPRSPDLTPLDFFFWGAAKEFVYKQRLTNVEDMKRKITDFFSQVNSDPDLCQKVCRSVRNWCERCFNVGGLQFEHL